ncbi:hypothetical protein VSS74_08805 [Conexibacter stalactiti]|uniref:Uncharacterized protein n=1 Tax=Conexibacter stalactiti TaxID=1940611 RepID=A0ABU4HNZ4_9ACTN|nr:hypothetical protein [Conexibacter stalactiti]MDW5594434.1 hypothetical protein [Conexibacter stalactiti]MEC5035076.1 hypothetical protein [Conexibacter stalactiti]
MTAAALLAVLAGAVTSPLTPGAELQYVYAGVTCRSPNSIACDRFGIAVAVRPRPRYVSAVVGGRQVRLARRNDGSGLWVGQLRDAGLPRILAASGAVVRGSRWNGNGAPLIGARIVATFADRRREMLPGLAWLCPGWG